MAVDLAKTVFSTSLRFGKEKTVHSLNLRMILGMSLIGLIMSASAALSRANPVGEERCLGCHGAREVVSAGKGYLYIDPVKFAGTTHASIGCSSCHDSVTARHPDDGQRPTRASCKECHLPVVREYLSGIHAEKAICSDCHNPHTVRPAELVSGSDMNIHCARCHDNARTVKTHSRWLPQAELHITALPCITCHTGSENYVINLYIQTPHRDRPKHGYSPAGYDELLQLVPRGKAVTEVVDADNDGTISLRELRAFHQKAANRGMRLWGMMMPEKITHTYQILKNRWDCTFCHASGPKALQTSYLAIPGKNGEVVRLPVEKGAILDLLYGTPDFYMMGTTRSPVLSAIGLAIVACGAMVPLLHGTLRFLTRKNRKDSCHGES